MPNRPRPKSRRIAGLACAGAVVFGSLAVALGNQADAQQPAPLPIDQLLGQELQGKAALGRVQSRLTEIAAQNKLSTDHLRQILATDRTAWLDRGGKLFYREPVATRSELKANTMKATVAETMLCSAVSTVATSSFHDQVHCSQSSSQPMMRIRKNEVM